MDTLADVHVLVDGDEPVRVWFLDDFSKTRRLLKAETFRTAHEAVKFLSGLMTCHEIRAADEIPDKADEASAQAVRQGKTES